MWCGEMWCEEWVNNKLQMTNSEFNKNYVPLMSKRPGIWILRPVAQPMFCRTCLKGGLHRPKESLQASPWTERWGRIWRLTCWCRPSHEGQRPSKSNRKCRLQSPRVQATRASCEAPHFFLVQRCHRTTLYRLFPHIWSHDGKSFHGKLATYEKLQWIHL